MQNTANFAEKRAFLNRKRGASPDPSEGREQKREPPPAPPKEGSTNYMQANLSDFCSPPSEGPGEALIFLQKTADSDKKHTFLNKIRRFLMKIRELFVENGAFCK